MRRHRSLAALALLIAAPGIALLIPGCGLLYGTPRPDDAGLEDDGGNAPDAGAAQDGGGVTDDAGADAGDCRDEDLDGFTDCDGDCDDGDPLTYPGAPEICGDEVNNDCNEGPPDGRCGGLGTFVAAAPFGSNANPGTQARPVASIAQGIANAQTIGGGVDVYVASGTYIEDLTMVEGISLHGGYEASGWTRDPSVHLSVIDSRTNPGLLFPSGITRGTSVDGFDLLGRSGVSSSSAVTVMERAEPTIEGNRIFAGNVSGNTAGVRVNPSDVPNDSASPLIQGNEIHLGGAGAGWGSGNGAWGVRADRTQVEIRANLILLSESYSVQRGVELRNGPNGAVVAHNQIEQPVGRAEAIFGLRVASSGGIIDGNLIHAGRCQSHCLGLTVEGNARSVVVTHNIVFGGEMAMESSAFWVGFEVPPATVPELLVHSNVFDGGGAGSSRSTGIFMGEHLTSHLSVGRFFNNVVRAGQGVQRYAMLELDPNIDPVTFENNALYVDAGSAGSVAGLYYDEGSNGLIREASVNALPEADNNLADDCALVDPTWGGDFHLSIGSNCIDAGSSTDLPATDYEGDPRPSGSGPDIGVDEVVP